MEPTPENNIPKKSLARETALFLLDILYNAAIIVVFGSSYT